jgi:hypothetical protein
VALGHLFGSGHETEPQTTDVVCVRKTLAYKAAYDGHAVYGTAGTDANKRFSRAHGAAGEPTARLKAGTTYLWNAL